MRICARMSDPQKKDFERLKRMGRYLVGKPRLANLYKWQKPGLPIRAYSDSDWAGDRRTRRSASGGVVAHGSHVLKALARQQTVIALFSCDAELFAICMATQEAMGLQSYAADLLMKRDIQVFLGSSAASSLVQRQGLGKAKHINIQHPMGAGSLLGGEDRLQGSTHRG